MLFPHVRMRLHSDFNIANNHWLPSSTEVQQLGFAVMELCVG